MGYKRPIALSESHIEAGDIPVDKAVESVVPGQQVGRLPAVDAARVFATFAIVWVHNLEGQNGSTEVGALCRFGTSFYVAVAALFVVRTALRPKKRTFFEDFSSRVERLLKPYAVWCLIYGLYYGARAYEAGHSWEALAHWWGPVAGTAIHLWFLPFVFFWGVLATAAVPHLLKLPRTVLLVGGLVTGLALYLFCYRWLHFAVSRPWLWKYHLHRLDRWIVEVPLFVSAVLVFLNFERLPSWVKNGITRSALPCALACFVGFVIVQSVYATQIEAIMEATHSEGRFMANLAGMLFLGGFVAINRSRVVQLLAPLGRYTYLLFLMHMLLIEVANGFVTSMYGYGTTAFSFTSSLVLFVVGLGFSWLIQHLGPLRFLRP